MVDQTFVNQINDNLAAFSQFSSTSALYLPGGAPPAVGSTFRNPDLAQTYRLLSRQGMGAFYRGELAADIVRTVQHPPVVAAPPVQWPFAIRPGKLEASDLAGYDVRTPRPTHMRYRGFDVFGMPTPSSGGSTVGEGLNIVENWDLGDLSRTQALHRYLEASALAFADRNRYVGDDTPRSAARRTAQPGVRPRAGVPDRSGPRAGQAGRTGRPRRQLRTVRRRGTRVGS